MTNPRITAYEALNKIEKEGAYSNLALDFLLSKTDADRRDKAFASNLFYGVIERKLTLDYQLRLYLSKPLKKLKPEVLTVLRLGTYQLLFMDKVPTSAAVNESVDICRKSGNSYACGLVNAVLRKVAKNGLKLPDDEASLEYLSVLYSCPEWLVEKWVREYGYEDTVGILKSCVGSSENYIKVNTCKVDEDCLISLLEGEKVVCEKTEFSDCVRITLGGKSVDSTQSFKKGLFHVQDMACQLCVKALQAEKGDRVFDLCAAPGGKSYSIAQQIQDIGEVLSFDIHEHRVKLIESGAKRLSLSSVKAIKGDATVYNASLGQADAVLCDVPCSGLGIIGKKPEIKYKNPQELEQLPQLQLAILKNASRYVKKGGRIVYSTCTLSKSENENVCERFLENNTSFVSVKPLPEMFDCNYITFMPHKNRTDGFFVACFERIR